MSTRSLDYYSRRFHELDIVAEEFVDMQGAGQEIRIDAIAKVMHLPANEAIAASQLYNHWQEGSFIFEKKILRHAEGPRIALFVRLKNEDDKQHNDVY